MRIEHGDRRERLMTNEALVRLVRPRRIALVLLHVLRQRVALPARVRALRTLVRLVPRVDLNVRLQRGALLERLIAQRALVRPLVAVDLHVLHQVAALDERVAALRAEERLFARVLSHVQPELGRAAEPLLAHVADLGPARVEAHVRVEDARLGEAFSAHVAHVRLLAGVRADVDDHLAARAEAFITVCTLVRGLA